MADERVLFLDAAGTTGWAADAPGGGPIPICGEFDCGGGVRGTRLVRFEICLVRLIKSTGPDIIGCEEPLSIQAQLKLKGRPANEDANRFLNIVAGLAEKVACQYNKKFRLYPVQAIRQHFISDQHGDKAAVMKMCQTLGYPPKPPHYDQSDACAGWDFCRHRERAARYLMPSALHGA